MNDDLFNISLNQGKEFVKYQGKIKTDIENQMYQAKNQRFRKKKEGFTNNKNVDLDLGLDLDSINFLQEKEDRSKILNQTNLAEVNEVTNLQTQYDDLQTQYNNKQKQVNDNSLVSINRTNSNNPYLNKNVSLSLNTSGYKANDLGYGGYVTGEGVFKPYPDQATFNSVAGKNGCPKNIMSNIPVNDFSSSLLQGENMSTNQSCGNEGKNVYVNKLVYDTTSSYVGCYNDKPLTTNVNAIPLMNSSNSVNGFKSLASSVYDDNNAVGAWAVFDQNPNTFWHSKYGPSYAYNSTTGEYQGTNQINFNSIKSGSLKAKGEYLQINMPSDKNSANQSIKVVKYDIAPRLDGKLFLQRSPNTWYLLGYKDGQWYEVDRQIGQRFTSGKSKPYIVANPGNYVAYNIVVEKVGNDDQRGLRDSLQIAELNLFVSSDANFTNSDRAMILNSNAIGYTTFENCQKYAIDNDYQYFGLQDLQSNGTAACLVSNDYDKTINYGDASKQTTSIILWSSNTATGEQNTMQIEGSGRMTIYDMNSRSIFNSNREDPTCANWGTLMVDSATYGGNCKAPAPTGNVTQKVGYNLYCNWSRSCSIPISNNTFGDPSPGCKKSFDVAYKCGGKRFSKNLSPAEGNTMVLDCGDYMNKECQYYMILQDDGNMCLYRGKDPSDEKAGIWMSNTNGKQKTANPNWVASKGKYGRNYMKTGETLSADEWIGSNSGSTKLMMQQDGNLVLYTSLTKSGCSVNNNKTFGSGWVNAVYKIDQTGNKDVLGKLAYIDEDTKLKEYPDSLLTKSNQYQLLNDFDSNGNDISQITTTTGNQGCIDACNSNNNCSGFVYQPKGQICYLKNSGMYPKGEKQNYPGSGVILGVRKPQIGSSLDSSCNKDIVNIDSIQYDNYIKGDPMTKDTKCGSPIVLSEDKTNLTNLQNNILSVGNQITNQSNNFYDENNNVYNTISKNSVEINKNINMYKQNDNNFKTELNLPRNNNFNSKNNKPNVYKEGMKNFIDKGEKNITMNDINSMLSDTDIKVLQENYGYIIWSILAIGLLTVTINQIKK
jgi:hypothetical protein